ncbi:prolyl oligopeptidase family serine peptidase [Actinoplanes teichomyceticus]|uniref:Dipeptidyl aminopeptidase/acylaminoacyl peptidase n=1 Tax=Actinoplanes teichomyceticus TaxID=1867 RepID=A0A561VIE6_ACTTI|nr:prolyl oligopeptidase family serine peptidase [Actinoplanes teichomyceticus]TWG11400.1 dipeptidyl aminopeptidase/acylaminoacyl peptidase [Actinoplanes teichomyceticus]GIF15788.1 peptidase S9 [Actinoplanes teichomyceticus]
MTMDAQDVFADLDAYVALPRLENLRLSPDGRRLVVGVGTPHRDNTAYRTSIWEVDPAGERPARRLTRSDAGESPAGFTPGGDLLFTSARPRPGGDPDREPVTALWRQPAGGDAHVLAAPPGGVSRVVAGVGGTVLLGSPLLPSSADPAADEKARATRKEAGVSAILHEQYPVRYWDHDLGPAATRLLAGDLADGDAALPLRDLTGHAGLALHDVCTWDVTPDGRTAVAQWQVVGPGGAQRQTLVAVDVASGERRTLADDADHDYQAPRISPDGTRVAFVAVRRSTATDPGDAWLATVPVAGGRVRALTGAWDRLPGAPRWTPDGSALVTAADDRGRAPLWRVDAASGAVTRLTPDDGAYTDWQVAPDGRWVYALRSAVDSPPSPVRVALDGVPELTVLPGPAESPAIPGRLAEVTATAADGTGLRAWLALPDTAGADRPAPLLLWIHGGPQGSWNSWSWRWNPWIAVAHGYAVLLPDPALSTGYGRDFIARGWGAWGDRPYTDLLALTDAAGEHPDVDAGRTAAMGGSFGGYMANWIAGHTDRFDAIVTHASLWSLEQFVPTTDVASYWAREMTREMTAAWSPHRSAGAITTPMLVIHGDRDYRVPIGEGLSLWWALMSSPSGPGKHKFLYFPDENHWILKPGNVKAWYATVLAFLDQHVRGAGWRRPELLG